MRNWKLVAIWAAWLLLLMLCSCTTTRYVEVPMVREVAARQRDTVTVRDSVYVHDSVMVSLCGDTVMVEKFNIVYRDRWRNHLRVDSFIQCDTVCVVKEVEKPPNRWQRITSGLGTMLTVGWAGVILLLIATAIYRIRRD